MALPLSGPLSMGNIRTELGMSGVSDFSLIKASSATFTTSPPGYPLINKYSRYRPPFIPDNFKISNWYGYNHTINTYFQFQPSTLFYGPTFLQGFYLNPGSLPLLLPDNISFTIIIQLVYPSTTSIITFSDTCTPAQYNVGAGFFITGYVKDLSTVYPGITSFNIFASPFSVFMSGVEYRGSSTIIP
jgi:hypothetical protein